MTDTETLQRLYQLAQQHPFNRTKRQAILTALQRLHHTQTSETIQITSADLEPLLIQAGAHKLWNVNPHKVGTPSYGAFRQAISEELNMLHIFETKQTPHKLNKYTIPKPLIKLLKAIV